MKTKYSSDYIYLKENYYKNPKEIFKFVEKNISISNSDKILDVGCARGEFLYYLREKKKIDSKMYGVDQSKKLIDYAKNKSPCINTIFYAKDFLKFKSNIKFSKIIIIGAIECFKDINGFVKKISSITSKKSKVYLLCKSNSNNADILSSYLNLTEEKDWQLTCLRSNKTILERFKKHGFKLNSKKNFHLPFKTKPKKDPMRAYTLRTEHGTFFANGLGMIYNLNLFKFTRI